jgi:hypothetical protein
MRCKNLIFDGMRFQGCLARACVGLALVHPGLAQSVSELQKHYSGTTEWNSAERTLSFTASGRIDFNKPDHRSAFWDVPTEVARVVIGRNVRVTGAFHTQSDCTIAGLDRQSSIVFGTSEQRWAVTRNLKPWQYCQFQNFGGVLTVSNLTALNPFAYFIRGWANVCHARNCDFIDDRGGWANHSDGFEGGHGSTINDCHLETGDDAIKLYFDTAVTNTSIKMIQNCVPFQFGWANYQSSTSHISNVTITGDRGRGKVRPVFQWVAGKDHRSVDISGLVVDNPSARLFDLKGEGRLDLHITQARIRVKEYGTPTFPGTRMICGSTEQHATYACPTDETAAH